MPSVSTSTRNARPLVDTIITRRDHLRQGRTIRGITDCWRISSPISRWRRIDSTKLMSGPIPQYWRTVK